MAVKYEDFNEFHCHLNYFNFFIIYIYIATRYIMSLNYGKSSPQNSDYYIKVI